MSVGFSVPIHQNSEAYLADVFEQYEEVEFMGEIENPIIHIYAKKDTYEIETGELNGYIDSLFCEYHFYDTKNMKCYKSNRNHDAIYFDNNIRVSNVKVFKDGSTLVQCYGKYDISYGTAIHLYSK